MDLFFKSNLTLRAGSKPTPIPRDLVEDVCKRIEGLESRTKLTTLRAQKKRKWPPQIVLYIAYMGMMLGIAIILSVCGHSRWILAQLISVIPVTYFLIDSQEVKLHVFLACTYPVALVFQAVVDQTHPCPVRQRWDDDIRAICSDVSTSSVRVELIRRLRIEDSCVRFLPCNAN